MNMLDDTLVNEVASLVVEPVEFEVQSFHPICPAKGELVGMHGFLCQRNGCLALEKCNMFISLAVEVGRIDKRLGIAEFQIPLGF